MGTSNTIEMEITDKERLSIIETHIPNMAEGINRIEHSLSEHIAREEASSKEMSKKFASKDYETLWKMTEERQHMNTEKADTKYSLKWVEKTLIATIVLMIGGFIASLFK